MNVGYPKQGIVGFEVYCRTTRLTFDRVPRFSPDVPLSRLLPVLFFFYC